MSRERPPRQLLRPRHHSSHSPESTTDEEGDAPDSYDLEGSESLADPTEEEDWVHPRGEIEPDDSASGSVPSSSTFDQPGARPRPGQRSSTRQHSIPPRRPPRIHPHAAQAPPFVPQPGSEYLSPMTSEGTPDYPDLHGHYPPPGAPYPYDRRPTYQPSGVSGFAPPPHRSPYGNQMVSWATGGNPFMRNGYYEPGHEMMTYSQPGYFGGVAPSSYGMPYPQHAMVFQPKPPPPPTVVGGDPPASPAEKQPDPQLEEMRKQLEMLQLERTKADEAKRQADLEKRIREDAERQFKDRMEAMKEAQEQAKKDIEVARIAAEAAALERLEEARKAEEERRRLEAELKAQAARDERERIENERKEQEKRDKEHALALEKAEREAREKYEAAKAAEEERKLELERQRLLIETQTKEKILADQKAAEEARIAAEAKAAEDKARKELAEKEARQKAIEEYEAKMAEEKKAAEAAAQAEAAAKLRFADEKRLADEKAAADAEQKKKDDEEMKRRILADAKAEEEKKAAEAAAAAPPPEGEKEPIKFKDAVGRKYSFPFKLASKWEQMQRLISQAFEHIDNLGAHVQEGHYDLEGPEGELILKEIWDTTVQPGWQITMKMWPLQDHPLRGARGGLPPNLSPEQRAMFRAQLRARQAASGHHHAQPGPPRMGGAMPMPPMDPRRAHPFPVFESPDPGLPPGVRVVDGNGREVPKKPKTGERRKKAMGWFGGGQPSRKSSKKRHS